MISVNLSLMMKCLITGITGQDGALLAKSLLDQGHVVHGVLRNATEDNLWRLRDLQIIPDLHLTKLNIADYHLLEDELAREQYSHIFHLAGDSVTAGSFYNPWDTFSCNTGAVINLLESVRRQLSDCTVIIAGSSEIFQGKLGSSEILKRNSLSPLNPTNPYGLSHLSNLEIIKYYRSTYNLKICLPIMFHHESKYRGRQFVTQKIVEGVVRASKGTAGPVMLGNLNSEKDWGSASEFMEFLIHLAKKDINRNLVLGTGRLTSIREILMKVFDQLEMSVVRTGFGLNEQYLDKNRGQLLVGVDSKYFRLKETPAFTADTHEILDVIGNSPTQTVLDVIPSMVDFALKNSKS